MKTLIHETPREIIRRELPALDQFGPDMWSFVGALAFSPWIDEETGAIRVGVELVARSVGKNHLVYIDTETGKKSAPNFRAKTILDIFINHIMPPGSCDLLDYVAPSEENPGMQRRLLVRWPEVIQKAITDELTGVYDHEERVYIKDGSKVTYRKQKAQLDANKMEAANITDLVATPVSKEWVDYLNHLPTNIFSTMIKNLDVARDEALKISNPHSQVIALKQLDIIREQPLPIYKATPRTTRIYTMTASIQNLPKQIRKVLMQGHVEFDLHHAQLAIVAKLWNIPSVDAFLASGKSLWKELIAHMGVDLSSLSKETYEDLKWYLKKYTYSTIFGMNENNLTKGNLKKVARLQRLGIKAKKVNGLDLDLSQFGIENAGEKFVTYPLMADILSARNRMLQLIRETTCMPHAFGQLIKLGPGFDERDILAQVAQSYEMFLLHPVLQFTKQNDYYMTVSLFSHDGFSVKFHNNQYKQELIDALVAGVNSWCKQNGINTWLEYEELPLLAPQPIMNLEESLSYNEEEISLLEKSIPEVLPPTEKDLSLDPTKLSDSELSYRLDKLLLFKRLASYEALDPIKDRVNRAISMISSEQLFRSIGEE